MDWTELLKQFLPIAIRLTMIIFSTLGVVYNVIAFFALVGISFAVTLLRDYPELVDGVNNQIDLQFSLK